MGLWLTIIGMPYSAAQVGHVELERRAAAAGFTFTLAMALGILRNECRHSPLDGGSVDEIAQAWWKRNQADLDAATWIFGDLQQRYRSALAPQQAAAAERKLIEGLTPAAMQNLRFIFKRQLPTAASCNRALVQFRHSQLDVANVGRNKGFEQLAEFGETLRHVREDPGYRPRDEKFRSFDAQVSVGMHPMLTLDAIEAAKERKDAEMIVRGWMSLIDRGDARAAHTLGAHYLNGQYVARDTKVAFAWFYNTWVMGEPEGANALGVMYRDGIGVAADANTALAAFSAARLLADRRGDPAAYQRAETLFNALAQKAGPASARESRCIRWSSLHEKLRQVAADVSTVILREPSGMKGNVLDDSLHTDAEIDRALSECVTTR